MALLKKSEYFMSLSAESQARYESKITSCGLKTDPYCIEEWTEAPENVPNVKWCDVMIYMVSTPSPYTREEIKAWKGMLDGSNFLKSGWVHGLRLHQYEATKPKNPRFVVMGKVKHSQRMSASFLLPWVILEREGEVLCAHCTCMAGLGEACSHIAAILSCLIRATDLREKSGVDACTSRQCMWLPPAQNVSPAAITDIKFVGLAGRKRDLESDSALPQPVKQKIPDPSKDELTVFYEALNEAEKKPAILRITQPYSKQFIPKSAQDHFPKLVMDFYNPAMLEVNYLQLLEECERIFHLITVTPEQVTTLERETRAQSQNKTWFLHRAARVTASNFKAAASTDPTMPSQSLIKRLCYPDAFKFSTAATRWGCSHESDGIQAYTAMVERSHENLIISKAGLFIDTLRPYIGASPDGIVSCNCCGQGVVEVKCPFCVKDGLPEEDSKTFCMTKSEGKWSLKKNHTYYYQIQLQMAVCKVDYGDFIVWTKTDFVIERIQADQQFISSHLLAVKRFYIYGVLPEVIGKFYTRKPIANSEGVVPVLTPRSTSHSTPAEGDSDDIWCYCSQPSSGEMILCDNAKCTIRWFHFDCLRIERAPKGKWYCPSCRKLPKFSAKRKK